MTLLQPAPLWGRLGSSLCRWERLNNLIEENLCLGLGRYSSVSANSRSGVCALDSSHVLRLAASDIDVTPMTLEEEKKNKK